MKELTGHKVNGCNDGITVNVLDEPGQGGACHAYEAKWKETRAGKAEGETKEV